MLTKKWMRQVKREAKMREYKQNGKREVARLLKQIAEGRLRVSA